jgi:large subunit ribosomal protein L17
MKSLVEHQTIRTTWPRAKELRPKMEKIISKAKKGDLANRRAVIAALGDVQLANKLVDLIAPQISRDSGYLRVVRLDEWRVGDNAPMATLEFVDSITTPGLDGEAQVSEITDQANTTVTEKKPAEKSATTDKKEAK